MVRRQGVTLLRELLARYFVSCFPDLQGVVIEVTSQCGGAPFHGPQIGVILPLTTMPLDVYQSFHSRRKLCGSLARKAPTHASW